MSPKLCERRRHACYVHVTAALHSISRLQLSLFQRLLAPRALRITYGVHTLPRPGTLQMTHSILAPGRGRGSTIYFDSRVFLNAQSVVRPSCARLLCARDRGTPLNFTTSTNAILMTARAAGIAYNVCGHHAGPPRHIANDKFNICTVAGLSVLHVVVPAVMCSLRP